MPSFVIYILKYYRHKPIDCISLMDSWWRRNVFPVRYGQTYGGQLSSVLNKRHKPTDLIHMKDVPGILPCQETCEEIFILNHVHATAMPTGKDQHSKVLVYRVICYLTAISGIIMTTVLGHWDLYICVTFHFKRVFVSLRSHSWRHY
jgi:hypothetical protein